MRTLAPLGILQQNDFDLSFHWVRSNALQGWLSSYSQSSRFFLSTSATVSRGCLVGCYINNASEFQKALVNSRSSKYNPTLCFPVYVLGSLSYSISTYFAPLCTATPVRFPLVRRHLGKKPVHCSLQQHPHHHDIVVSTT